MQPSHTPDFLVFTGNANPALAAEIASHLGISLGAADVGRFSDGEVTVELVPNRTDGTCGLPGPDDDGFPDPWPKR